MRLLYHWLFPAAWLLFGLYWFISARWAAKIKAPEPWAVRLAYSSLTYLVLALIVFRDQLPGYIRAFLDYQLWPQTRWNFFVGVAMTLAGLGFAVWARVHLGAYWSASVALKENHRLIRGGPYRLARHPIYTGILTAFVGSAIALAEVIGLLGLVICWLILLWKSRREERLMLGTFGDEYAQYRKEVPAFMPLTGAMLITSVTLIAIMLSIFGGSAAGKRAYYETQVYGLEKQVFALEKSGKKNRAAHEILAETRWLLDSSRDWPRIAQHIAALRSALNDPSLDGARDEQSPSDGSWGKWYTEWFFKLDASYDQIADLADEGKVPEYPVHFLDGINAPDNLTNHLNALLISDPGREGVDHRREFNETISDLMRLILRDQPANYAFHPQLKAALMDFLIHRARDPQTGYWGEWYQSGDAIRKTADLSITFHIVSYLKGDVPNWPKIIDTTLAHRDEEYPLGWLESGEYLNHNNMDVVELFRLGWPHATRAQQDAMRVQIQKMLNWCLEDSLQPDGSFKLTRHDDSVETCICFGASFLERIGYFDPAKNFWSHQAFPGSDVVKQHIIQRIQANLNFGGEGGVYYRDELTELAK